MNKPLSLLQELVEVLNQRKHKSYNYNLRQIHRKIEQFVEEQEKLRVDNLVEDLREFVGMRVPYDIKRCAPIHYNPEEKTYDIQKTPKYQEELERMKELAKDFPTVNSKPERYFISIDRYGVQYMIPEELRSEWKSFKHSTASYLNPPPIDFSKYKLRKGIESITFENPKEI